MALNISPNFVRFARSDDEGLSAGDESAHEQRLRGEPGSRRYRRYLNTQLSDYESEFSATDVEDEQQPIIDFEWNSDFTRVGTEFYAHTDRSAQLLAERLRKSHERKLRGRRKVMDKLLAQFSDEEDEADLYGDEERKESRRLRRKARRQKTSGDQEATDGGETATETEAEAEGKEEKRSTRERESDYIPEESSWANWQRVDVRARPLLRRMNTVPFLKQLEAILIPFKFGKLTAEVVENERRKAAAEHGFDLSRRPNYEDEPNFTVLSFPETSLRKHSERKHSKKDSDDDEEDEKSERKRSSRSKKDKSGKHKSSNNKKSKQDDEMLVLVFRDAYLRFLAHGIAQFHHLICSSDYDAEGNRITTVRRPKDFFAQTDEGVYVHLHHLSLCAHVAQMSRLSAHRTEKGPMVGRWRGNKLGRAEEEEQEEEEENEEVEQVMGSLRALRVEQGRSSLARAPGGPAFA